MCSFSLNTNNSQGLECVVEGWKTQKGEDLGDRKALEPVVGENTGKKWHFLAPRWRSKVTKRERSVAGEAAGGALSSEVGPRTLTRCRVGDVAGEK